MKFSCSAGGLIVKDNEVLLVKITYGANKDHWMLPGGFVEEGETIEEAAIREVREETGVETIPIRLLGVRTGVRQVQNDMEQSIYFIFEMELVSEEIKSVDTEVSSVQFRSIDEILLDPKVVSLTKEVLRKYKKTSPEVGLFKVNRAIETNNKYIKYDLFLA